MAPATLVVYRLATRALGPLSGPLLSWRRARGKEDAARIAERHGEPSAPRPPGALVWLHGASVGEALSLLPLIERLSQSGRATLVTTGTVTSARLLAERLPPGALHQYAPLDAPQFMRRFIAHWRPDVALIAESELWPNMILETSAAETPIILVNARLSERSYRRWKARLPNFIGALLARIDLALAQSQADAERFTSLGAPRVEYAGNLKFDAPAPPADLRELAMLSGRIAGRRVWIAASTHEGEETQIAEAHRLLVVRFPELLTLIAPRHPNRGGDIALRLKALGLDCALRSKGAEPGAQAIYICDTIGELGLFYRLAGVVFLGRSLGRDAAGGGQNPIEPAKLASAVLHGPHVANFADVYELLDAAGGAALVRDAEDLAGALASLFADGARLRAMARAAAQVVESQTGAVDRMVEAIEHYLPEAALEPAE
jgi:3-deoxy-D-manno-octulosonic-acid transferase